MYLVKNEIIKDYDYKTKESYRQWLMSYDFFYKFFLTLTYKKKRIDLLTARKDIDLILRYISLELKVQTFYLAFLINNKFLRYSHVHCLIGINKQSTSNLALREKALSGIEKGFILPINMCSTDDYRLLPIDNNLEKLCQYMVNHLDKNIDSTIDFLSSGSKRLSKYALNE